MRTKQYLAAIRAADNVLVLETLYFADEIRDAGDAQHPEARAKVPDRELRIAEQLIDSLTIEWKPERYEDTYRERVLDLVRRKGKGQEIDGRARAEAGGREVVDLVEALQRSLDTPEAVAGERGDEGDDEAPRVNAAPAKRPAKTPAAAAVAGPADCPQD